MGRLGRYKALRNINAIPPGHPFTALSIPCFASSYPQMARSIKHTSVAEPAAIKIPRAKKGSGQWPCIYVDCPAKLSRKGDVMRHVDTHSNHTVYKHRCSIGNCNYSGRQKGNLNAHIKRYHTQQKENHGSYPLRRRTRSPSKRKTQKSKDEDERLALTVADIDYRLLHPAYTSLAEDSSSTTSIYSPHPTTSGFSTNATPRSLYSESLSPPQSTNTLEIPTAAPFTSAPTRSTSLYTGASTCSTTSSYGSSIATSGSPIHPPPRLPALLPSRIWDSPRSTISPTTQTSVYDKGRYQEALHTAPSSHCGGRERATAHGANIHRPSAPFQPATPWAHTSYREYSHRAYVPARPQTFEVAYQVPTPASYPHSIPPSSTVSQDSPYYPYSSYPSQPAPYPPRPALANYHYEVSQQVRYYCT